MASGHQARAGENAERQEPGAEREKQGGVAEVVGEKQRFPADVVDHRRHHEPDDAGESDQRNDT